MKKYGFYEKKPMLTTEAVMLTYAGLILGCVIGGIISGLFYVFVLEHVYPAPSVEGFLMTMGTWIGFFIFWTTQITYEEKDFEQTYSIAIMRDPKQNGYRNQKT